MLQIINEQINFSFISGGTDKIKKSVQATGINDRILAIALEPVLQLGKSLRKQSSGVEESRILIRLKACYRQHLTADPDIKRIINPLLDMRGMSISFLSKPYSSMIPKAWIFTVTRQQRYSIHSYWALLNIGGGKLSIFSPIQST